MRAHDEAEGHEPRARDQVPLCRLRRAAVRQVSAAARRQPAGVDQEVSVTLGERCGRGGRGIAAVHRS